MKSVFVALALVCIAKFAGAQTLACPDLAAAVQAGVCPTEEELRYTFTGYCSDNARMYERERTDSPCANFENYRRLKNVVLWESADGEFHAYLSCDLSAAAIRSAKPARVAVGKSGTLTRVECGYGEGIVFAHRTRAVCRVESPGPCTGAECRASCTR